MSPTSKVDQSEVHSGLQAGEEPAARSNVYNRAPSDIPSETRIVLPQKRMLSRPPSRLAALFLGRVRAFLLFSCFDTLARSANFRRSGGRAFAGGEGITLLLAISWAEPSAWELANACGSLPFSNPRQSHRCVEMGAPEKQVATFFAFQRVSPRLPEPVQSPIRLERSGCE